MDEQEKHVSRMEIGEETVGSNQLSARVRRFLEAAAAVAPSRNDANGNGAEPAIDSTYSAIYKRRCHDLACQNLNGMSGKDTSFNYGSFFNKNDSRSGTMHRRFLFDRKQNISFSFNPATMQCECCNTPHSVISVKTGDVFALTDQNFPPVLPTTDGKCIRIIRVENGSLVELAETFLKTVSGWSVGVGSVVILSSVTRLAQIGLAGYAAEMVRATKLILASMAGGVTVKAGPAVLLDGCNDPSLLRSLFELDTWLSNLNDNKERFLGETMRIVLLTVRNTDSGTSANAALSGFTTRMLLPVSLSSYEKRIWASGEWQGIPNGTLPLDENNEKGIIESLIAELNKCFAVNLNASPSHVRAPSVLHAHSPTAAQHFTIVGASLASALATSLEKHGAATTLIKLPSWRPNPGVIAKAAADLEAALTDGPPTTILFQNLDGATYYAR